MALRKRKSTGVQRRHKAEGLRLIRKTQGRKRAVMALQNDMVDHLSAGLRPRISSPRKRR